MKIKQLNGITVFIDDKAKELTLYIPPRAIVKPERIEHDDHTAKAVVMPLLWAARDQNEYLGIGEEDYFSFAEMFSSEEHGPIVAFARLHLLKHGSLDRVAREGLLRTENFNGQRIYFPTFELARMGVRKY